MTWFSKRRRSSYENLRARDQARRLGYRVIFTEALLEVAEDGELTESDAYAVARGAAAAVLLYFEEPLLEFMKRRGIFVAASSLLNYLTAFYLAGLGASYFIDPKKGVANYNRYIGTVLDIPEDPKNANVTIQRTSWAIATVFFNQAKSGKQKQAERRVEQRGGSEAGVFRNDQLDFGIFGSLLYALG